MADTGIEPVGSSERPPAQGGHGIKATLKRIKPGEWALIGLGVASLVLFFIWYQRNQASTASGVTGSAAGTNPNWGSAQTGDSGTFAGEIADLLSQIASGGTTTPGTSPTGIASGAGAGGSGSSSGGGGSSGGTSAGTVSLGGTAGGAQGTGNAPVTAGLVGAIDAAASSGSGISSGSTGNGPAVPPLSATILGPLQGTSVNKTSGATGNVGIPIASLPNASTASTAKVPVNVTPGGVVTAASTVGANLPSKAPPAIIPVNVVTINHTVASAPAAKPAPVTAPKPAPAPAKVVTPTKAPANVRAR